MTRYEETHEAAKESFALLLVAEQSIAVDEEEFTFGGVGQASRELIGFGGVQQQQIEQPFLYGIIGIVPDWVFHRKFL